MESCLSTVERRLVVTYTTTGQTELRERLKSSCGTSAPEVLGWYGFLISHFIQPYLPAKYPDRRVEGFNFEYRPHDRATTEQRQFDSNGWLTRAGLASLASAIADSAGANPIDRLSRIYDEIYVDEVQDLTGWDLDILERLLLSPIRITLVGDIRQSVYDTNPYDKKFSKFRSLKMIDWFESQQTKGRLQIAESLENWRCRPEIVALANRTLPQGMGFSPAVSRQAQTHAHQGLFRVSAEQIDDYIRMHRPLALRWSSAVGKTLQDKCSFQTMGEVKGITADHVLILPTKEMLGFLATGSSDLKPQTACKLYVSVTRARFSVAFILDHKAVAPLLKEWTG